MTAPDGVEVRRSKGWYHGRPTLCLANGALAVEVLAAAGPRIVGLRLDGSPDNLLAETPDLGWETPYGRYELLGGHRLWVAPEDPARAAVPDSAGLAVEELAKGVRLTGPAGPATGCIRSIEIRLDADLPAMTVLHRVHNAGPAALELAPWSITQLPLGGVALLPQRRALPGHDTRPNRNVVLWPYTSWDDSRLRIRDGLLAVEAVPGDDLKVGCLVDVGWVAYVRGGVGLVRRFEPATRALHPDLGCNAETFCGARYLELELLGPLAALAPGATTTLAERWEVRDVSGVPAADAMLLRDVLAAPIDLPAARTA